MPTSPFEAATARKFRLNQTPTLLAQQESGAPIAFTRVRCISADPAEILGRERQFALGGRSLV